MVFAKEVNELLWYVSVFGKPEFSKHASEALVLLETRRYETRASAPIGRVNSRFPVLDGTRRTEVLLFLRDRLHLPITEDIEEVIWNKWQEAWNQTEIRARDLRFDLDDTCYDYEGNIITGREVVWLRDTIIYAVALALRDREPPSFASHSALGRIVDYANHPGLSAFRFAFFLRMPGDPPITNEEVDGMPGIAPGRRMLVIGRADNGDELAIRDTQTRLLHRRIDFATGDIECHRRVIERHRHRCCGFHCLHARFPGTCHCRSGLALRGVKFNGWRGWEGAW